MSFDKRHLEMSVVFACLSATGCAASSGVEEELRSGVIVESGFEFGPEGTRLIGPGDDSGWRAEGWTEETAALRESRRSGDVDTQSRDELIALRARELEEALTTDREAARGIYEGQVRVAISLVGAPALPTNMPDLTQDERDRIAAEAEATVRERQRGVRELIEANGGFVTASLWLGNTVQASVARETVDALWRRDDVTDVSVNRNVESFTYEGNQLRLGTGAAPIIAGGVNGDPPGTFRGKIGFIDASSGGNWPLRTHPVFQDSPGGPTRFVSVMDCNACVGWFGPFCTSWGCATTSATTGTVLHSTFVAGIAAGSIEQGQDPFQTTTTARTQRSGMASETDLVHYGMTDCDAMGRAFQRAVVDGVNVLNMSAGTGVMCSATADCGGVNAAIRSAFNSGTSIVTAVGNSGAGGCALAYPSYRPEVVAVGALDSSGSLIAYTSLPFAAYSSGGGMPINVMGVSQTMAGVGVLAPGDFFRDPTNVASPANYTSAWSLDTSGTSLATPVVSGGQALFIDATRRSGFVPDSRSVLVNTLLMGDRWGITGSLATGVHVNAGMGRFVQRAPGFAPFTGSGVWGWGGTNLLLSAGTNTRTVGSSGPETGVGSWRWVTAAFADNLNAIDFDYTIQAVDTCLNPGAVIASDNSFDLRKRISLSGTDICPTGPSGSCRCISMRINVLSAPASGVAMTTSDFFAAGSVL